MRQLHLISNAHLDPVWLWEWEEGAAEAISTFRTAADFCDRYSGYVFNHNEAVLYQWIEEYEPALFGRIQELVRRGRWHIMGGWYLQPDCNMPSGESFVRQILVGRLYFREKFGAEPSVAINFDPFGHSRGLVQIMNQAGYTAYVFCRPGPEDLTLPDEEFTWIGFDGSQITAHRAYHHYLSHKGQAADKVRDWIRDRPDDETGLVLWGIGNHGGGASQEDLEALSSLMLSTTDPAITHSTPEEYFQAAADDGRQRRRRQISSYSKGLNPWAVGCYTSQIRIKQKHRELENALFSTEKLSTHATLCDAAPYPRQELQEAQKDLLFCQFHDILPGSSIQPVEEAALRRLDHGLEILSRVRARLFFAMAATQPKAIADEIPILVYNPHPFPVETVLECEMQLPTQNRTEEFTLIRAFQDGESIPSQIEKEESNLSIDWRKRVVIRARLRPSSLNRVSCRPERVAGRPEVARGVADGPLEFETDQMRVVINEKTGLIDCYQADGQDYLAPGALAPLVIRDSDDPWETRATGFTEIEGRFALASPDRGSHLSGVSDPLLPALRIVEDGPVRMVAEAILVYGDSHICQTYLLPKRGTEMEVRLRVFWNEKSRMLKLSIPTTLRADGYWGQTAFGIQSLPSDGSEAVAQRWTAAASLRDGRVLTCINDGTYGSSFADGEMRQTLLRSPAYSALPVGTAPLLPSDRFSPRIDQGERLFRFWLNGGPYRYRMERLDREATVKGERPTVLSFFPPGTRGDLVAEPPVWLEDEVVQMSALKRAEDGDGVIIRLFEPTGEPRSTRLMVPSLNINKPIRLKRFQVKTLRLTDGTATETDLLESPRV